jgi:hypothetical protein
VAISFHLLATVTSTRSTVSGTRSIVPGTRLIVSGTRPIVVCTQPVVTCTRSVVADTDPEFTLVALRYAVHLRHRGAASPPPSLLLQK